MSQFETHLPPETKSRLLRYRPIMPYECAPSWNGHWDDRFVIPSPTGVVGLYLLTPGADLSFH